MEKLKHELTTRDRVLRCFDFLPVDRAPFIERVPGCEDPEGWKKQGMPAGVDFQKYFGLDYMQGLAWVDGPNPPFEIEIIEEKADTIIRRLSDNSIVENSKIISFHRVIKPPISNIEEWREYKKRLNPDASRIPITTEKIQEIREGHNRGDFYVQGWMTGFFGKARDLLGPEGHLISYYDDPEMIHDISKHWLEFSIAMIDQAFKIVVPDMFTLGEDLAYKCGAMISRHMLEEFLGPYYRKLTEYVKSKGVRNILIDTDGNYLEVIPFFKSIGVTGFFPNEVQAGMDVNEIRRMYPGTQLLGGVDKRRIYEGKKEIENEVKRIAPAIKTGGYMPCCDHVVPRQASLQEYKYYLELLKAVL